MKLTSLILGATTALLIVAGNASAAVHYVTVYNNPFDFAASRGNCIFSTTCAATVHAGDVFAAQKFTLSHAEVITRASFSELDSGIVPTDVTWGFLLADGTGGLPGTILAAGTDSIFTSMVIGGGRLQVSQNFFDVGAVALGPGTYYLALQAISPVFGTFLGEGVDNSGAARSSNAGVTWQAGYTNVIRGVAVALYAVPEPATMALFGVSLLGLGLIAPRRRTQ